MERLVMNDLISIIVPIYNVEFYLEKCLDSIINQTYREIEIILINDGSSDDSKAICEKYESIDNRIRLINSVNKGVSSARNTGLEVSNGKYILFIDPDDWMEENMIEKLYTNLVKTNSDISVCNYYEVNNGNKYSNNLLIERVFDTEKFLYYSLDERYFRGYLWNKLYCRHVIFCDNNHIKFDKNIHMCEDLLFNYKVALNSSKICYTDDKLYNYLQRENSALSSQFNMKEASRLLIFKELIDVASKYNNKLVQQISFEYVSAAIDIKYKMTKNKGLSYKVKIKLNTIINKNIMMGLKSQEYSLLRKLKLIIKNSMFYLYNALWDLKKRIYEI